MTLSTMPASRAMRIISRAVLTLVAIGFSTCKCLPAAAHACTASRRKSGKVQTSIASTSGQRHSSWNEGMNSTPYCAANFRPDSSERLLQATRGKPMFWYACACLCAMAPVPKIPIFTKDVLNGVFCDGWSSLREREPPRWEHYHRLRMAPLRLMREARHHNLPPLRKPSEDLASELQNNLRCPRL